MTGYSEKQHTERLHSLARAMELCWQLNLGVNNITLDSDGASVLLLGNDPMYLMKVCETWGLAYSTEEHNDAVFYRTMRRNGVQFVLVEYPGRNAEHTETERLDTGPAASGG